MYVQVSEHVARNVVRGAGARTCWGCLSTWQPLLSMLWACLRKDLVRCQGSSLLQLRS